jgi:hypothetical protein
MPLARAKRSKRRPKKGPQQASPRAASPIKAAKRLCALPPRVPPPLSAAVMANPIRANAILFSRSKWVNGTVLHYCFFKSGHFAVPKKQAEAVRAAFSKWRGVGIGLKFKEVSQLSEAEVRIGYSVKDGDSQSTVGREILNDPLTEPTTIYGWDLTTKEGRATALHEIGHVLGMEHEHQNPFAGIKWHEEAVYENLAEPPNEWTHSETFHNILEKLSPQQVQGSKWDPDSIMEYEFEPGLIAEPKRYETNGLSPPGTLSAADRKWVRKWYPPLKTSLKKLQAFKPAVVDLAAGKQIDFVIEPAASRKYRIETKGASDTTLVLFEVIKGEPRYVSGDDDSGEERNAAISHKLFKGRQYVARLRLVHPGPTGQVSLMYA